MNCQSCLGESDSYIKDNMPSGLRKQVEDHLCICSKCEDIYRRLKFADRVINKEKEELSNPFLLTRIMAKIENSTILPEKTNSIYNRAFKPAIIALTLATSVLTGVFLGNIYEPVGNKDKIPYELAIINDATIESVDLFLED